MQSFAMELGLQRTRAPVGLLAGTQADNCRCSNSLTIRQMQGRVHVIDYVLRAWISMFPQFYIEGMTDA